MSAYERMCSYRCQLYFLPEFDGGLIAMLELLFCF